MLIEICTRKQKQEKVTRHNPISRLINTFSNHGLAHILRKKKTKQNKKKIDDRILQAVWCE